MLKTVVNEFLADPVKFKAENVPPKKALTQKAVMDSMGDEGVRNSKEQFSVRKTITQTTSFYNKLSDLL